MTAPWPCGPPDGSVASWTRGGAVPKDTHDWRLFIKPHELAFLLQASGFLVDTSTFRGMAPTVRLGNPLVGAANLAASLRTGTPPPLPLSDFVEISSLEVQYLGYAVRPSARPAASATAAESDAQQAPTHGLPPQYAPGELARGLREASRAL